MRIGNAFKCTFSYVGTAEANQKVILSKLICLPRPLEFCFLWSVTVEWSCAKREAKAKKKERHLKMIQRGRQDNQNAKKEPRLAQDFRKSRQQGN